jgi:hypothetical protein
MALALAPPQQRSKPLTPWQLGALAPLEAWRRTLAIRIICDQAMRGARARTTHNAQNARDAKTQKARLRRADRALPAARARSAAVRLPGARAARGGVPGGAPAAAAVARAAVAPLERLGGRGGCVWRTRARRVCAAP